MAKKKEETADPVEPKSTEKWSLYAWYSYVDKEGYKTKAEYRSEGANVGELLAGIDFPAGCNRLVNVTVTHDGEEFSKALAPHKARAILEHKSEFDFNAVFRGV